MILTNNESLAKRAKHITTTAKVSHTYEFVHDEIAFNYRLPNLNASMGCAQFERLPEMLKAKEEIMLKYKAFFSKFDISMISPIESAIANNWLNTVLFEDKSQRDEFLKYTNENGVMTRPVWKLMTNLSMFQDFSCDSLLNSKFLEERLANIPSSVPTLN